MQYRAEIDGLRSIAVLPVILFHGGLEVFGGGFAGVDIFFVISGYLITTILYREAAEGRFSILRFYERRARRILPALLLVTCVSAVAAWIIMLPAQLADFGKSIVAVNLFVSNILFWRESGYFAAAAELKPLLHTWSLAVEEQFYILFPLFVALAVPRLRYAALIVILIIMTLASLILADIASVWKPVPNFYLLPTRAWELLIGALCAVYLARYGQKRSDILALIGAVSIIASIFLLSDLFPYPSRYTLAPVLGTALIILFAHEETLVGRVLSLRPMVWIGLISYSAYLWHQPLFAFARLLFEHPPLSLMMSLAALSLGLAYLSWHFVEQPFRVRDPKTGAPQVSNRGLVALLGVPLLAITGYSVVAAITDGFRERYIARLTPKEARFFAAYETAKSGIWATNRDRLIDDGACRFHAIRPTSEIMARFEACYAEHGPAVVVTGDSHAMDLYNGIALNAASPFVFSLSRPGCRLHAGHDTCFFPQLKELAVTRPEMVSVVLYQQAGFYLMQDEAGNTGRRSFFEKHVVPDYQVNHSYLDQIDGYLAELAKDVPTIWVGARIEPHLTPEKMVRGGCTYTRAFGASHLENFHRLDQAIAKRFEAPREQYWFLSEIDAVQFKAARDLYDCETIYWSDGDHWSLAGEEIFGARFVAFAAAWGTDL